MLSWFHLFHCLPFFILFLKEFFVLFYCLSTLFFFTNNFSFLQYFWSCKMLPPWPYYSQHLFLSCILQCLAYHLLQYHISCMLSSWFLNCTFWTLYPLKGSKNILVPCTPLILLPLGNQRIEPPERSGPNMWIQHPPYSWKNPPHTTTCVTSDAKHSTALALCLLRRVEWISRLEQCGVLGILCHTGGSLQQGLLALRITRVVSVVAQMKEISAQITLG